MAGLDERGGSAKKLHKKNDAVDGVEFWAHLIACEHRLIIPSPCYPHVVDGSLEAKGTTRGMVEEPGGLRVLTTVEILKNGIVREKPLHDTSPCLACLALQPAMDGGLNGQGVRVNKLHARKRPCGDGVEFWHTPPIAQYQAQNPTRCPSHVACGL